ncbi:MAG TPA: hypothetical protein VKB34_18285 [Povalibacter sp.]|nr:hypothetical protein [Povalibacter sp.]
MSLPKSILSLCCLVLLSACSEPDSPEAQVRKAIDAMETAAEARDTSDVMEFVATDFRDAYGQGAAELETYLRGYFIANQSLHLLTRINRIDSPPPTKRA